MGGGIYLSMMAYDGEGNPYGSMRKEAEADG